MSEYDGPLMDSEDLLREEREEKEREWWKNYENYYEMRDQREDDEQNEIVSALRYIVDALDGGDTEKVKAFLAECIASAERRESLDDTAWDYYAAHRKEIANG